MVRNRSFRLEARFSGLSPKEAKLYGQSPEEAKSGGCAKNTFIIILSIVENKNEKHIVLSSHSIFVVGANRFYEFYNTA